MTTTTPAPSSDRRHARRLLVTIVITTAAAAVTAGVVLKKHPPGVAAVQRAAVGQALVGVARDLPDGATTSDPSLPSAAAALRPAAESAEEPATF